MEELTCTNCNRVYLYNKKAGHTKKVCNSCMANKARFRQRAKIIAYMGNKCIRCGYSVPEALCCHHMNPTEKEFTISGNHGRAWSSIQQELDKCVLLCQNCHIELHAGLWRVESVETRREEPKPSIEGMAEV